MTDSIYHTTNYIPFLGFLISIILTSGFYLIGKVTIKYFGLKNLIKDVSETKYQNILIGVNTVILFSFPIVLWTQNKSNNILIILTYFIFILGLLNLIKSYKKYKIEKLIFELKKIKFFELLVCISVFFYFMISSSSSHKCWPLDYHLHIGKNSWGRNYSSFVKSFPFTFIWQWWNHNSYRNSCRNRTAKFIIQFCGLISILGIIKHKNKYKINFYIYLLSAPIIIFFLSSIKPQFFFIASTSLVFSLLIHTSYKRTFKS